MDANDVLALGLGVTPPWKLVSQRLDTGTHPHQLHLEVAAERGALFPCPTCGKLCKAHDFAEFTWRHLNFFQHHCYVTAKVPRTDCPEDGILRIKVPWAREGSRFTLLFEQAALVLVREMPVLAAARIIGVTDQRLWRIVEHYVTKAVERMDLSRLKAIGLDETAAKRGQSPSSSTSMPSTNRSSSSPLAAARRPLPGSRPSLPSTVAGLSASPRSSAT
jgi:transposase